MQSNPIVFFALGQGSLLWHHLAPKLDQYGIKASYLHFSGAIDANVSYEENIATVDNLVKKEIARIWNEFLDQGQNATDIVRVNYIITTDEAGLLLPIFCELIEKYLGSLYPAGILADIYCLLDDDRLLEKDDNRKMSMEMLLEEQARGSSVYLLSNLTSQNEIIPFDETAQSIAMLSLFKDRTPDLYVTGADASRYNEFYFMDNCYLKNGQFLTAASLNVAVPSDALEAFIVNEILSFGRDLHLETGVILEQDDFIHVNVLPASIATLENLQGLAIPQVTAGENQTRRHWLKTLFDGRLEFFIDDTRAVDTPLPIISPNANIYDLIRYTAPDGLYETYAQNAIDHATAKLAEAEEMFEQWLSRPLDLSKDSPEAKKRRLSPIITQDLWPYVIAWGYIKNRTNINYLQDLIDIYKDRLTQVRDNHKYLLSCKDTIDMFIQAYAKKAEVLNQTFAPFTPKASVYFKDLFNIYATDYYNHLVDISSQFLKAIENNVMPDFLENLKNYVAVDILPTAYFDKPIIEVMQQLIDIDGKGNIATALGDWVFNHRKWNVRLKTGYAGLHTEINLFMPDRQAANVKAKFEERGLGRMNLFVDKNANQISVLYHAGAFKLQDLFYESMYSKS